MYTVYIQCRSDVAGLHTAHCTLHTAHCTLHTSHCTPAVGPTKPVPGEAASGQEKTGEVDTEVTEDTEEIVESVESVETIGVAGWLAAVNQRKVWRDQGQPTACFTDCGFPLHSTRGVLM